MRPLYQKSYETLYRDMISVKVPKFALVHFDLLTPHSGH